MSEPTFFAKLDPTIGHKASNGIDPLPPFFCNKHNCSQIYHKKIEISRSWSHRVYACKPLRVHVTWGCIHTSLSFLGINIFFYISLCKNFPPLPICDPILPRESHYLTMLPNKFQLRCPSGSWEEELQRFTLYIPM